MYTRVRNNRAIWATYHGFCHSHCYCIPEPGDEVVSEAETDSEEHSEEAWPGQNSMENGDDYRSAANTGQHQCSGSCTEVARSCSWAYTGECMCTASSIPDPWGLFSPHGCAAVVRSTLGGRGLVAHGGNSTGSLNSSSMIMPNSIVKGSNGYYNVSTGVQIACPCNTTCVSYGCCGSNGTTFEPQDRCLGKLDIASA